MEKSYVAWYRLRSFLVTMMSFLIFSMFLTTFLISRSFMAAAAINHSVKEKPVYSTSQILHVDSYFLQVYLDLSDQQIEELHLLYNKYINCIVTYPQTKYWHWLDLMEKIRFILTQEQRELFEKILKKIKYREKFVW
ncbi:hypothetical protein [Candidatus Uabimicrobium amorphum]|uniref:Uncharacterized protein n=1 Tax=Uabimicrobium amorphum TaxID=2596890 RepID=A0A5S9IS51_UABAM|nr:hypothetical protein [Candidatus Uabimicrobium amorphum]BBM86422.1 hypothetical protein UABAM_04808 [Candidatus Uabimicrobium amorphum]